MIRGFILSTDRGISSYISPNYKLKLRNHISTSYWSPDLVDCNPPTVPPPTYLLSTHHLPRMNSQHDTTHPLNILHTYQGTSNDEVPSFLESIWFAWVQVDYSYPPISLVPRSTPQRTSWPQESQRWTSSTSAWRSTGTHGFVCFAYYPTPGASSYPSCPELHPKTFSPCSYTTSRFSFPRWTNKLLPRGSYRWEPPTTPTPIWVEIPSGDHPSRQTHYVTSWLLDAAALWNQDHWHSESGPYWVCWWRNHPTRWSWHNIVPSEPPYLNRVWCSQNVPEKSPSQMMSIFSLICWRQWNQSPIHLEWIKPNRSSPTGTITLKVD